MSNDNKALAAVVRVLEDATEGLHLHQIVQQSSMPEDAVKRCLRELAGTFQIELIPTRGRWGNRYASTASMKPVVDVAAEAVALIPQYLNGPATLDDTVATCGEISPPAIETTLDQRGQRYGKFTTHAAITQELKRVMAAHPGWANLADDQKESLEMVAHKIGRIVNGDPDYDDSWIDIAGYTTLVADRLRGIER